MIDAPAYVRLYATGLTMLAEKEYSVYVIRITKIFLIIQGLHGGMHACQEKDGTWTLNGIIGAMNVPLIPISDSIHWINDHLKKK